MLAEGWLSPPSFNRMPSSGLLARCSSPLRKRRFPLSPEVRHLVNTFIHTWPSGPCAVNDSCTPLAEAGRGGHPISSVARPDLRTTPYGTGTALGYEVMWTDRDGYAYVVQ